MRAKPLYGFLRSFWLSFVRFIREERRFRIKIGLHDELPVAYPCRFHEASVILAMPLHKEIYGIREFPEFLLILQAVGRKVCHQHIMRACIEKAHVEGVIYIYRRAVIGAVSSRQKYHVFRHTV